MQSWTCALIVWLTLALPGQGEEAWNFACPQAGTVARYAPDLRIGHQGPAAAAGLCRVEGQRTPWVLGVAGNQDPVGQILQGMLEQGFLPARPGAIARRPPYTPRSDSGAAELSLVRFATIDVAAGRFDTAELSFRFQRRSDRVQSMQLWLDRASGLMIRFVMEDTNPEHPQRLQAELVSVTRP